MKLYICWTTLQLPRPPRGHPCHNAHKAVTDAGYDPEVIKVHGLGVGPQIFHQTTEGRKEVERLTGKTMVPVLVTDDDEVIQDSQRIVEWAKAHPAPVGASAA
jgi:hypothetical protein